MDCTTKEATQNACDLPAKHTVLRNNSFLICMLIVLTIVVACRIGSVFLVPDVFVDEETLLGHIESIVQTGCDMDGDDWPLYVYVGFGVGTYPYFYPMAAFLSIIGVSAVKARIVQQLLTIGACFLLSFGIKCWSKNKNLFWLTLFTALTLPWGFVQANRIWDPALVALYFSAYFFFFSLLMKSDRVTERKKILYSALVGVFLVLVAVVYPPCRIPAVGMWLYSMVFAYRNRRIGARELLVTIAASAFVAMPLALRLLDSSFNARTADLLVFQKGGVFYQELFQWAKNFGQLFSPNFLFISGDIVSRHSLPIFGMLGTISVIPLVKLLRQKLSDLSAYMIAVILLTCISTALTNDYNPHGLRSCLCFMPYAVLIAYGWDAFLQNKKKNAQMLWLSVMGASFAVYFFFYILLSKGIITLHV